MGGNVVMRRPLDGPVRVTSDTAEHALRGVGPATDYARPGVALPIGTPVVAPFPIARLSRWGKRNDADAYPGGLAINGYSADGRFLFVGQHLNGYADVTGPIPQGGVIAYSGNTGGSTGPHLHCYVVADGVRMSMEEAIAAYGGTPAGDDSEPFPPIQLPEDTMPKRINNTDTGTAYLFGDTWIRHMIDAPTAQANQRAYGPAVDLGAADFRRVHLSMGCSDADLPAGGRMWRATAEVTAAQVKLIADETAAKVGASTVDLDYDELADRVNDETDRRARERLGL